MALYEVVFIARQDLSAEEVDTLGDKFVKIVKDHKGKLVSREYWGLRDLAYKINKSSRGHYVLLNFDSEFEGISELKRVIGFNEDVIRSMIFNVDSQDKQSLLMVAEDAKSFKAGKIVTQGPSDIDAAIDQIVVNNLIQ